MTGDPAWVSRRSVAVAGLLTGLGDVLPAALDLYADLHRHPELSGAEERTASRFAKWLHDNGFDTVNGVGGHGVVGVLRNGPGPAVALRADMDALPLEENTDLPHRSPAGNGVMHACGHDFHLACAAAAAALLARSRDRWSGTVLVYGQPAEETLTGARAMLSDGLYDRFGVPDVVLAQHVGAMPPGVIAHGPAPLMAGAVELGVTVHGRGAHGACPDAAVDPVVVAAAIVLRLQTVVSRETSPTEPLVVTVGTINAGAVANVIPDSAHLGISVRAFTEHRLEKAVEAVSRVVRAECAAADCPADPEIVTVRRAPVNVNDPVAARRVVALHRALLGDDRVLRMPTVMSTEDFAWFGAAGADLHGRGAVPTVYWFVSATGTRTWDEMRGTTPGAKLAALPGCHSARFAPDVDEALPTGVLAFVGAALAHLQVPDGTGDNTDLLD